MNTRKILTRFLKHFEEDFEKIFLDIKNTELVNVGNVGWESLQQIWRKY